jgi:hypothetical protein
MAATDYKISSADISAVHVEAQPTVLRGSATQNKQVFDKYSDMIVDHFNDLCDFISSDTSATIDRDVLVLYESLGWVQD